MSEQTILLPMWSQKVREIIHAYRQQKPRVLIKVLSEHYKQLTNHSSHFKLPLELITDLSIVFGLNNSLMETILQIAERWWNSK